ncbi:MAG: TonB-dependent receptor [Saprospiraceae bacterium]|nr:MAG: TonB-dependent receptor [Saprospiraceae bacterium]
MRTIIQTFALLFATIGGLQAQTLYGNVFDEKGDPLIGATVLWQGTQIGTVTDEHGDFWIEKRPDTAMLVIQYVGIDPVTVEMYPHEDTVYIRVEGTVQLQTVEVQGQRTDNYTSTLAPANVEHLSSKELRKAPCCSLAESFETTGSVDVMRQDAVTSATEIQMLGLRGPYTQLLFEKRPAFAGLSSPLALEFIPGTWISGIQISKGTSSVQSGPQAIAGQINVEAAKPMDDKPLFVNLFGSTTERGEVNVHLNRRWSPEWSSGILLHGSTTQGTFDRNGDTFMDLPNKHTLDALFRTFYQSEQTRAQFNVQLVTDERTGGQMPDAVTNGSTRYTTSQRNNRLDVFGKMGYLGFDNPRQSLGFIYSFSKHDTDNRFGNRLYTGQQTAFYANLLLTAPLADARHTLHIGSSFQYDDYREKLDETPYSRKEIVPGSFVEYAYEGKTEGSFLDRVGLIAGIRIDHHNLHGWFVTPRLNLKYNFDSETILRMNVGRGWRTAQIFAENLAVLATSRQIVVEEGLQAEDAWNYGLNFTRNFKIGKRHFGWVLDAYLTDFNSQVVMDMESEHGKVLFYNLDGPSRSYSLLALLSFEVLDGLHGKVAWKFNDVKTTFRDGYHTRPLFAAHRALLTLDYETQSKRWMVNLNLQYTGPQRFANGHHVPDDQKAYFTGTTPGYVLVNAQLTRRFERLEIYAGGENLTDYRQQHAIVAWDDPFGPDFDAMQVWAPLVGIRGYVGLRWWIE